jgi:hypothetical protein
MPVGVPKWLAGVATEGFFGRRPASERPLRDGRSPRAGALRALGQRVVVSEPSTSSVDETGTPAPLLELVRALARAAAEEENRSRVKLAADHEEQGESPGKTG